MTVRAKFRYTGYSATHITRPILNEHGTNMRDEATGQYAAETIEARTMLFAPVYGGGEGNNKSENKLFWQATPSGKLELQMVNPEAWSKFTMGKAYYLIFEEAPD